MPEHTIPEQLIEDIRSGRVTLVIGAGIGVSSWKQLLERITEELRNRGQEGDSAAAKDVDRLLHKGNLVRAAGFLARNLGEASCDSHAVAAWSTDDDLPQVAQAIARLPIRQVWTTFPGNALEKAMEEASPQAWPAPRVVTYAHAGDINRRRRTVLKILGDFDSFVVTPASVRKALSGADELRAHIREDYTGGRLLLVGFRYGDPDLAALLDRVFGSFEPPKTHHYMVASGVGPVTVDELESDHHIRVINLSGKGADEKAVAALLGFLETLREQCDAAGATLAQSHPDEDDLEGWMSLLAEQPDSALGRDAVLAMESAAREAGDADRLIEILMSRVELEESHADRADLLRQVAEVFQTLIGDVPRAFTALTAALRENPSDMRAVDEAERLAEEADGWTELVADVSEVAREITDRSVAAAYWQRLGLWYNSKLAHLDYSIAAYREALRLDPAQLEAYAGLEEVYRKQQRWAELAESITAHVELEPDGERQVDLYLALGDLNENQLASTAQATAAYQSAADIDSSCDGSGQYTAASEH